MENSGKDQPSNTIDSKDVKPLDLDPGKALSQCMLSQYVGFTAAIVGSTGYSVLRKPPNGIAIMLVSGAAGSTADMVYGWNIGCQSEVKAWRQKQKEEAEWKLDP